LLEKVLKGQEHQVETFVLDTRESMKLNKEQNANQQEGNFF